LKKLAIIATAVVLAVGGIAGSASATPASAACKTFTYHNVPVKTRLDNTDGSHFYVSAWRVHPDASTNAGNCAQTDVKDLVGSTSKIGAQYQGYPEFPALTVKAGSTKYLRVGPYEITGTLYRLVSTHAVTVTLLD
jgi:hypothetical protein